MTDETDTVDDSTVADDHPYRISGVPPVPFEDNTPPYDDGSERGETVHAVLELGRPKEDPTVDRVFYDAQAAQHHANRIKNEANLPAVVIETKLE